MNRILQYVYRTGKRGHLGSITEIDFFAENENLVTASSYYYEKKHGYDYNSVKLCNDRVILWVYITSHIISNSMFLKKFRASYFSSLGFCVTRKMTMWTKLFAVWRSCTIVITMLQILVVLRSWTGEVTVLQLTKWSNVFIKIHLSFSWESSRRQYIRQVMFGEILMTF